MKLSGIRKASSLIFTENEGLVDKHGHHLMPAMPIFQKNVFFEKGPKSLQFLKKIIFFCISCSIFIGLFNGPLFVFIMSMVGGTQKETLLPSHLNWPPLYLIKFSYSNSGVKKMFMSQLEIPIIDLFTILVSIIFGFEDQRQINF